jgi:hypothetical protein
MTPYSFRSYLKIALVVCVLLLLSACAAPENKQSPIEERVTARWDALLAGDLAGAYEYLSPGYRSSVSSLQYQRTVLLQQIKYTSAKYLSSECEESTCNVRVLVGFTVYGALPGVKSFDGTRNIDESWVQVDGNWYMVPEK